MCIQKLSKFDHIQSLATVQWIGFMESSVAEGNINVWGFDGSDVNAWKGKWEDANRGN